MTAPFEGFEALPEESQKVVNQMIADAERHRTNAGKRDQQIAELTEKLTGWESKGKEWEATQKQLTEQIESLTSVQGEYESSLAELETLRMNHGKLSTAVQAGLPADWADRLKGSSPEEWAEDAKGLAAQLGIGSPTRYTDPSQGRGSGTQTPLNSDAFTAGFVDLLQSGSE